MPFSSSISTRLESIVSSKSISPTISRLFCLFFGKLNLGLTVAVFAFAFVGSFDIIIRLFRLGWREREGEQEQAKRRPQSTCLFQSLAAANQKTPLSQEATTWWQNDETKAEG